MGRPRTLPTSDVLFQLRTSGGFSTKLGAFRKGVWTYDQIADEYGCSRQAVHLQLRQAGMVKKQTRHVKELPWKVAESDNNHVFVTMLRYDARMRHGNDLPEYRQEQTLRWIEALATPLPGAPDGCVIDYTRDFYLDPQTGKMQGWGRVPRRVGIDEWLIREPIVIPKQDCA